MDVDDLSFNGHNGHNVFQNFRNINSVMLSTSGDTCFQKPAQTRASQRSSAEKLARKREQDRLAQHEARRRTKTYIAYLESIVERLQAPTPSDTWMKQVKEKHELNETLATALRSIKRVAEDSLKTIDSKRLNAIRDGNDSSSRAQDYISTEHPEAISDLHLISIKDISSSDLVQTDTYREISASHSEPSLPRIPGVQLSLTAFMGGMDPHGTCSKCGRGWRLTKTLMEQVTTIKNCPISNEITDIQIPVQVMLFGWDAAEQLFALNPVWQIIRQIDKKLFFRCSPILRLAVMCLSNLTIKFQIDPSNENFARLPSFMKPRPCQRATKHPVAVDYFPWPGVREHLIFSEHEFCSTTFSEAFVKNYRYTWPSSFSDAYVANYETGIFEVSETFLESLHNPQSWTMDAPFFEVFPQLRDDILCSPSNEAQYPFSQQAANGQNYVLNPQQSQLSREQKTFEEGGGLLTGPIIDQRILGHPVDLTWSRVLKEQIFQTGGSYVVQNGQ